MAVGSSDFRKATSPLTQVFFIKQRISDDRHVQCRATCRYFYMPILQTLRDVRQPNSKQNIATIYFCFL